MELPLGGPALRHYTQSRPRPHRQKLNYRPSRPQETIIESENEVLEHMGRVDEGVEEFFTKKVLPTDTLKKQDEEIIIQQEVAPASSAPCPPQPKTLRRKLGDFFTLRKRRGLKSETSHEGRPKKASIADLIRPLREVARAEKEKDKERVKEHDKENEKEKTKESPTAVTGELDVQETPVTGAAPLRGEAVPPRRALREGKSQSLILLSGSSSTAVAAAGTTNARNTAKKQFEGQHSFEQKLHLMLQRIGVSKAQPGEAQNPEREMKKAESEGTIIDSKPEPPPTFTKPRTMSASSDTRHQIRPSVSAHESAGKPALLPKPVIKPGPAPSTSGRNTPENELTQTQKGETDTPTKQSPPATPSSVSTTTTPTVLTISDSAPHSTSSPISPASTVTDSNICTDSGKPTTAATTSTNVTELNSKSPAPESSITTTTTTATEVPNSTLTSTDPHAPASLESITPSPSITSTTTSPPSITTSETVSAPSTESSVSTASSNLSAKSTRAESNGILSVTGPASVVGDAATSVTTTVGTASLVSTAVSDAPSHTTTTTTASTTEARDDLTSASAAPTSCATLVSSVTTTTSRPQSCCDTITLSSDAPITSPPALDSIALPPTGTTSASTTGPTSTDCMDILSPSSITHSATHPAGISVPSTSSSETKHTDTKTSLTATISPPLTTHSDPPSFKKANTTASSFTTTDSSSASSTHLTSPVASSPSQDTDLKTHRELSCSAVPTSKPSADDRLEMVQESKQAEKNESKAIVRGIKESDTFKEKPAPINKSEVASKEVQEESGKPEEATATKQAAEPASGKKGVSECHNQRENKSKEEK